MATIGQLRVLIGADIGGLEKGLKTAQDRMRSFGSSARTIGAGMTAGITAPLLGIVAAANSAGTAINRELGNVQSLGLSIERVTELKAVVQDLAIDTGKSTTDVAAGLYEVISAFGDTADTAKILEINVKAGAAGLATTQEAIALTSAVTKGYNDVSAEAVQKTADLAFVAVNLGQTTFPELAASMGKIVPLAAALGMSQEDLFATMATATGVTGSASEVSTQMRGTLQALMAPTANMTQLIQAQGFASGEAMLQQLGYHGTLLAIVDAAEKGGVPLQKFMGSIEGQTLALAMAGPLAELYGSRLEAMNKAAGATDAAFTAQTEGINASGFAAQQAAVKWEVFLQKLDEGLGPAKLGVISALAPIADQALVLADKFADLDPSMQTWIVAAAGAAAAAGPLLIVLGSLATALAAIGLPAAVAGLAIIVLAAVVASNWTSIQTATTDAITAMEPYWIKFQGWLTEAGKGNFAPLVGGLKEIGQALAIFGGDKLKQIKLAELIDTSGLAEKLKFTEQIQGQLKIALGAVDAKFDVTGLVTKLQGEVDKLRSGAQAAFDEGGWAGLQEHAKQRVLAVADGLTGGLSELSTLAQLGVVLAVGQVRTAWNQAFTGENATVFDTGKVATWIETQQQNVRAKWDELMAGDNVLSRSVGAIRTAAGSIRNTLTGIGDMEAAAQFGAVLTSVSTALKTLNDIKIDAIGTVVDGLTSTATGLANLATVGVKDLDPAMLAEQLSGFASNLKAGVAAAVQPEKLGDLGSSLAGLSIAIGGKIKELFADPNLGKDLGSAIGGATAVLLDGATALVQGIVNQISQVNYTQFEAQADHFVRQFFIGVVSGLMETDWAALGTVLRDLLLQGITSALGSKTTLGLIPGPAGTFLDKTAKGLGVPTTGEMARQVVDYFYPPVPVTAEVTQILPKTNLPPLPVTVEPKFAPGLEMPTGWHAPMALPGAEALQGAVSQLTSWNIQWPPVPVPDWLSQLKVIVPDWLSQLQVSTPDWLGKLKVPAPDWLGGLKVPRPAWIDELWSAASAIASAAGRANAVATGGSQPQLPANALGTRNFRGGWSLVGENGPELVAVPAGASIFSANETRAMLAGAGEGGVQVTVHVNQMNSELDAEAWAYKIAQKIRAHQR